MRPSYYINIKISAIILDINTRNFLYFNTKHFVYIRELYFI